MGLLGKKSFQAAMPTAQSGDICQQPLADSLSNAAEQQPISVQTRARSRQYVHQASVRGVDTR